MFRGPVNWLAVSEKTTHERLKQLSRDMALDGFRIDLHSAS